MRRDFILFLGSYAIIIAFLASLFVLPIMFVNNIYNAESPQQEFSKECLDSGGRSVHTDGMLVCKIPGQLTQTFGG